MDYGGVNRGSGHRGAYRRRGANAQVRGGQHGNGEGFRGGFSRGRGNRGGNRGAVGRGGIRGARGAGQGFTGEARGPGQSGIRTVGGALASTVDGDPTTRQPLLVVRTSARGGTANSSHSGQFVASGGIASQSGPDTGEELTVASGDGVSQSWPNRVEELTGGVKAILSRSGLGVANPGVLEGGSDPRVCTGLSNPGESTGLSNPGESTGLNNPGGSTGLNNPGESAGLINPGVDRSQEEFVPYVIRQDSKVRVFQMTPRAGDPGYKASTAESVSSSGGSGNNQPRRDQWHGQEKWSGQQGNRYGQDRRQGPYQGTGFQSGGFLGGSSQEQGVKRKRGEEYGREGDILKEFQDKVNLYGRTMLKVPWALWRKSMPKDWLATIRENVVEEEVSRQDMYAVRRTTDATELNMRVAMQAPIPYYTEVADALELSMPANRMLMSVGSPGYVQGNQWALVPKGYWQKMPRKLETDKGWTEYSSMMRTAVDIGKPRLLSIEQNEELFNIQTDYGQTEPECVKVEWDSSRVVTGANEGGNRRFPLNPPPVFVGDKSSMVAYAKAFSLVDATGQFKGTVHCSAEGLTDGMERAMRIAINQRRNAIMRAVAEYEPRPKGMVDQLAYRSAVKKLAAAGSAGPIGLVATSNLREFFALLSEMQDVCNLIGTLGLGNIPDNPLMNSFLAGNFADNLVLMKQWYGEQFKEGREVPKEIRDMKVQVGVLTAVDVGNGQVQHFMSEKSKFSVGQEAEIVLTLPSDEELVNMPIAHAYTNAQGLQKHLNEAGAELTWDELMSDDGEVIITPGLLGMALTFDMVGYQASDENWLAVFMTFAHMLFSNGKHGMNCQFNNSAVTHCPPMWDGLSLAGVKGDHNQAVDASQAACVLSVVGVLYDGNNLLTSKVVCRALFEWVLDYVLVHGKLYLAAVRARVRAILRELQSCNGEDEERLAIIGNAVLLVTVEGDEMHQVGLRKVLNDCAVRLNMENYSLDDCALVDYIRREDITAEQVKLGLGEVARLQAVIENVQSVPAPARPQAKAPSRIVSPWVEKAVQCYDLKVDSTVDPPPLEYNNYHDQHFEKLQGYLDKKVERLDLLFNISDCEWSDSEMKFNYHLKLVAQAYQADGLFNPVSIGQYLLELGNELSLYEYAIVGQVVKLEVIDKAYKFKENGPTWEQGRQWVEDAFGVVNYGDGKTVTPEKKEQLLVNFLEAICPNVEYLNGDKPGVTGFSLVGAQVCLTYPFYAPKCKLVASGTLAVYTGLCMRAHMRGKYLMWGDPFDCRSPIINIKQKLAKDNTKLIVPWKVSRVEPNSGQAGLLAMRLPKYDMKRLVLEGGDNGVGNHKIIGAVLLLAEQAHITSLGTRDRSFVLQQFQRVWELRKTMVDMAELPTDDHKAFNDVGGLIAKWYNDIRVVACELSFRLVLDKLLKLKAGLDSPEGLIRLVVAWLNGELFWEVPQPYGIYDEGDELSLVLPNHDGKKPVLDVEGTAQLWHNTTVQQRKFKALFSQDIIRTMDFVVKIVRRGGLGSFGALSQTVLDLEILSFRGTVADCGRQIEAVFNKRAAMGVVFLMGLMPARVPSIDTQVHYYKKLDDQRVLLWQTHRMLLLVAPLGPVFTFVSQLFPERAVDYAVVRVLLENVMSFKDSCMSDELRVALTMQRALRKVFSGGWEKSPISWKDWQDYQNQPEICLYLENDTEQAKQFVVQLVSRLYRAQHGLNSGTDTNSMDVTQDMEIVNTSGNNKKAVNDENETATADVSMSQGDGFEANPLQVETDTEMMESERADSQTVDSLVSQYPDQDTEEDAVDHDSTSMTDQGLCHNENGSEEESSANDTSVEEETVPEIIPGQQRVLRRSTRSPAKSKQ